MNIRLRLTLLYACALFVAGAILVALMYVYLQQSLDSRPGAGAPGVIRQFLSDRGVRNRPVLDSLLTAVSEQAQQDRRDTLRGMLVWSLVSLAGVGIAAGGFGWLLAGRALQPLQDVTATARRVADHSLHERIALDGPTDEIKELADTFDAMLERLDRAFDGQRRFVANASHELRTPLAINRTLIEVALEDPDVSASTRQLGATLLEVNQRHERLIDGLLLLAKSDQELENRQRIDLAECVRRAVDVADDAMHRKGIHVQAQLAPAFVIGDPALLERIAQNLVDNAVRHNRAGGWVAVRLTTDRSWAWLVVENSGPVVPSDRVDSLFEPFRRLAVDDRTGASGGGAGLGLSIVRSIATAHGGSVRATARPDGGLAVAVALPRSQ